MMKGDATHGGVWPGIAMLGAARFAQALRSEGTARSGEARISAGRCAARQRVAARGGAWRCSVMLGEARISDLLIYVGAGRRVA